MPGTVLSTRDTSMEKKNDNPCPHLAYILMEGKLIGNKHKY